VQLFDNPAHVFAAASNSLLQLWNTLVDFMPAPDLLSAHSLLQDAAVPAAALAMGLARAYAGDDVFCATVMYTVLAASRVFAHAAAANPEGGFLRATRNCCACQLHLTMPICERLLCMQQAVLVGSLTSAWTGLCPQFLFCPEVCFQQAW
jgi:hypothetical protein